MVDETRVLCFSCLMRRQRLSIRLFDQNPNLLLATIRKYSLSIVLCIVFDVMEERESLPNPFGTEKGPRRSLVAKKVSHKVPFFLPENAIVLF